MSLHYTTEMVRRLKTELAILEEETAFLTEGAFPMVGKVEKERNEAAKEVKEAKGKRYVIRGKWDGMVEITETATQKSGMDKDRVGEELISAREQIRNFFE